MKGRGISVGQRQRDSYQLVAISLVLLLHVDVPVHTQTMHALSGLLSKLMLLALGFKSNSMVSFGVVLDCENVTPDDSLLIFTVNLGLLLLSVLM